MTKRQDIIERIIHQLQDRYRGCIVAYTGSSLIDYELENEEVEVFETYMLPEIHTKQFKDFVWDLELNLAEPNGFSIVVHDLTPEETRKYRPEVYRTILTSRYENALKECWKLLGYSKSIETEGVMIGYTIDIQGCNGHGMALSGDTEQSLKAA